MASGETFRPWRWISVKSKVLFWLRR